MAYAWNDFEQDQSTDGIANKYVLTIVDGNGEEFATIVHRATPLYPIDSPLADLKRANARLIVMALNIYTGATPAVLSGDETDFRPSVGTPTEDDDTDPGILQERAVRKARGTEGWDGNG